MLQSIVHNELDMTEATIHTCMLSLCDPIDYSPPGFSVHGDSPGMNTEVGCHALLQRIFLTQGWNPCLLCPLLWQVDSLPLARGSVYTSALLSQFVPPSPSPAVSAGLLSPPAFLFLSCNTGFMGTCHNLGHLRIYYVVNKWKLFPAFIPRLHGFENLFYSFRKIGDVSFLPVHNWKAHFGFRNNMRSRVPWRSGEGAVLSPPSTGMHFVNY